MQDKLRAKYIKYKAITGTTNQFIADAIQTSRTTISRFADGKRYLNTETAKKLDTFISISIKNLAKLD